ncbi:MAG: YbaK/EbsC family protein [Candidatus Micrarchaeota archaeon]
MSDNEVKKIQQILQSVDAEFQVLEHEPVRTSEDAARVRKNPLCEGIKAIVVKPRETKSTGGITYYVADVSADKKVDLKKLAEIIGVKSLTLAPPDEVLQVTGCEVGGVPPLGHKTDLQIYVDESVFENEFNEFNAGLTTVSIRVESKHLKKAFEKIGAKIVEIAK